MQVPVSDRHVVFKQIDQRTNDNYYRQTVGVGGPHHALFRQANNTVTIRRLNVMTCNP